jgi:chemotaxis protein MotB
MAAKRKNKQQAGAPMWVVTFGDMMSLLLCFFILLQMFSELKKDHEYQRVVTAIKEAFGYAGGIGVLPIDDPPLKSLVETLETLAVQNNNDKTKVSASPERGLDGPEMRVTKIREGIMFTIGGPATFEPFSAELNDAMKQQLEKLAVLLGGRRNKVEVIGHAAAKYLPENQPWRNLDELSYRRAENVKNHLVELGLDDEVFRLQAAGTREPVRPRAIEPADAAENRRVDIILTEMLVDDVNKDALHTSEDAALGG